LKLSRDLIDDKKEEYELRNKPVQRHIPQSQKEDAIEQKEKLLSRIQQLLNDETLIKERLE
jgi:hypothetical protein